MVKIYYMQLNVTLVNSLFFPKKSLKTNLATHLIQVF
jgi:hypothetical protein